MFNVRFEQSNQSWFDVYESIIKYPKSDDTGIFLIMLASPLAPMVVNDDRLGDVKYKLNANISKEPDVYDDVELNCGELVNVELKISLHEKGVVGV